MKLAHINNLLLVAVVGVNVYTIVVPLVPAIAFWRETRTPARQQALQAKIAPTQEGYVPGPNTVTIPSMLLDQPILEGPKKDLYKILDKGIWHWPDSSTPDKGSNTVLLGHRLTYTNPRGVLYNLDKVHIGNSIGLVWEHKKYTYRVVGVVTVRPSASYLTAPTAKPTLTVYTCTPLWRPHDRLVVTAELIAPTKLIKPTQPEQNP